MQTEVLAALGPPLNGDTIWVADDNADVRLLLSRAFKRFFPPVSVEYFADGAAIVEHVRKGVCSPKLLLLDVEMPSLDGIEVLKTLKVERYLRGTTVLIFSTMTTAEIVRDAYATGAHFFLQKPVGGGEYRDLAKLCLKCLDLPMLAASLVKPSSALHVTAALAIIEAAQRSGNQIAPEMPSW